MQKYINQTGIPLSVAVFLATDWYDHNDDPNTYSATTLLKPLRQLVLAPRVSQEAAVVDVSVLARSRFGTAIHSGIEAAWTHNHRQALLDLGFSPKQIATIRLNPTDKYMAENPKTQAIYLEQRFHRKITVEGVEYTVSGAIDFIAGKAATDFKNTQTYAYQMDSKKEDFAKQGSIYRWLVPDKITKDQIEIVWIFGDWKPFMYKPGGDYPPKAIHPVKYDLASLDETERFITNKLSLINQYKDAPEETIPECNDVELWRRPYVWKYYKKPENATKIGAKSTNNFPDDEAGAYMKLMSDGNTGAVKKTGGEVIACLHCPAFHACTQKDRLIADGSLTLK